MGTPEVQTDSQRLHCSELLNTSELLLDSELLNSQGPNVFINEGFVDFVPLSGHGAQSFSQLVNKMKILVLHICVPGLYLNGFKLALEISALRV